MSSFFMILDRIPAFVIYIALFGTATGLFGHFWRVIHGHPILFRPPYSPYLKAGTDGPFILVRLPAPQPLACRGPLAHLAFDSLS